MPSAGWRPETMAPGWPPGAGRASCGGGAAVGAGTPGNYARSVDERARRTERLAATGDGAGRLRLATERLRSGARAEALDALAGLSDPRALALQGEVLLGLERLDEAWEAAAASVRADPAALGPAVAVPLAQRLLQAVDPRDPLSRLAGLRRAVDLGDAALEAVGLAAEDEDPLVRGLAARVPALRSGLRADPSPYVRFMASWPDPDARANAWRRLARVELDPGAERVMISLPEGSECHDLRLEVVSGQAELFTVRVHDERGRAHEEQALGVRGLTGRARCRGVGRAGRTLELELGYRAHPAAPAWLSVWGDDTREMATRLFGAHGPDFDHGLLVGFEARYPARLAFFEAAFFRRVERLFSDRDEHLVAFAGGYGLGFEPEGHDAAALTRRVEAVNRSGALPFHLELTGPRPIDRLRGLAPSDTLSADDERLARRFAMDLGGHPGRFEPVGPERALHRQLLGLFPPRTVPPPRLLDPLLDRARVEYGPVGYRAVESFVEKAIQQAGHAPGGGLQIPLDRAPFQRVKPEDDQR